NESLVRFRHEPRCGPFKVADPAQVPGFRCRSSLILSRMLLDSLVSSSLMGDIEGTRSLMTLMETRIGTDNKAPGTPQSQVQKISETKMITGFKVKRRPSRTGVIKFASKACSSRYQPGGRSACQTVSSERRPTAARRMMPATGPK